jgi:hypothetical protein
VQQEQSEQADGVVPGQRTDPATPPAAHRSSTPMPGLSTPMPGLSAPLTGPGTPTSPAAPETPPTVPVISPTAQPAGHRAPDETVVLPAFLTGKKPAEPKPAEPVRHQVDLSLPASERGMLVFVATLLGLGTIAVVTVLGLGGFSDAQPPPPKPSSAAAVPTPTPSPVASSPDPSPTPAASSVAPSSASPSSKRPIRVTLGALTKTDPAAFCTFSEAGRAREHDGSWSCTGTTKKPHFDFTPNDICQWRYTDKTAYAVADDATDPSTWKCFT